MFNQKSATVDSFMELLPEEIILNIFSFFNEPREIATLNQVAKSYNRIINDESFWKMIYAKNIGNPESVDLQREKSFKAVYKRMYLAFLRPINLTIVKNSVNEPFFLNKLARFGWKCPEYILISCHYPLHLAVFANAEKMLERVLQAGASIDIPGNFGEMRTLGQTYDEGVYPLHLAAIYGNKDIVCLLLKAGAVQKINSSTTRGNTPIAIAIKYGHVEVVKILLAHGAVLTADYRKEQENLLHMVGKSGNEEMFNIVFFHNEAMKDLVNLSDGFGNTPLHYAAKSGNPAIVKAFLENGAKLTVNSENAEKNTPLHLACASSDYLKALPSSALGELTCRGKLVQLLLDNGAINSVNMENFCGNTPLHEAAENGCIQSMKLLLQHGADKHINKKNTLGKTPYDYAEQHCSEADVKKLFGFNLAGKCTIM